MILKNSQVKDNYSFKRLFYNKNIDILFNERNFKFDNKDMGELLFREMILDNIILLDKNHVDESSIYNWYDSMKENLVEQYYGFVSYVDVFLSDKEFEPYCNDCYEKAIECSIDIYEKVSNYKSKKNGTGNIKVKSLF